MRKSTRPLHTATLAATSLLLCLGSGTALSGEITGTGKSLQIAPHTLNGKSACAFSGLNDTYSGDPTVPDAGGFFRTQSWGQLAKDVKIALTLIGINPGNSCNPS